MMSHPRGRKAAAIAAAAILAISSQAAMAADMPYGNPYDDERGVDGRL